MGPTNILNCRRPGDRAVVDWISLGTLTSAVLPGDKFKAAGIGETVRREAPHRTS
jgi:hypothetical protein